MAQTRSKTRMESTPAMPSTTTVEGSSMGSLMRHRMVQAEAPSIRAASTSSVGMFRSPPK